MSPKLSVLVCAIHKEPTGYIGGGWTRLIELLKKAPSNAIDLILLETQPTFGCVHELAYEAVKIPHFLNYSFAGRIVRCLVAVVYGVLRIKKGDIQLIVSPVELPECVLPAYLISKITRVPWTSEIHLIPCYGSFWKNEDYSGKTSSFRSLLRESQKGTRNTLFAILNVMAQRLVFRAFKRGLMLAPSKSVVEDMQHVDADINVRAFYPGNGIALDIIVSVKNDSKYYDSIYVGVLTEKKGVFDALFVWDKVVKKNPHLILAIVGRGSEENVLRIKRLVKQLHLEENVVFPFDLRAGAPCIEDVWLTMKRSKMLLHLSVSDTWPQVIGEALACGLPVVTYNLRPQLYAFGECPVLFVVPIKDKEKCCSQILNVLNNYSENYEMIAKEYSKKFTWEAVLSAEKEAYESVIHKYYTQFLRHESSCIDKKN